jgi:predicted TIM-barrel fold metal-dependent hydrolase
MIFDVNAWLGVWPYRQLNHNTPEALVSQLDRSGIDRAAVSLCEAALHRNVAPANERLAEMVDPFVDQLMPLGTINPTYRKWEHDLEVCHERFHMPGIRLFPIYHNYAVDGPEARNVVTVCAERGLPVQIPFRMEDPRQRHWTDPGRTVDVSGVANLLAAVPSATLILTNTRGTGRIPMWQREDLRERNWFVDLSLAEVHRDLANLVEAGGGGHILFGSHVPFSYTASALVKLATLPVDDATREAISGTRAQELYGP